MSGELDLDALRKTAEAATGGPWHWAGNTDTQRLYLATWRAGHGRYTVMDFERWGMQGATPRFNTDGWMIHAGKKLAVYEVARNQGLPDDTPRKHPRVYRADVVDVHHPDARHIAAFDPPTVLALLDRLESADARAEAAASSLAREIAITSTRTYEHTYGSVDLLARLLADEQLRRTRLRADVAEAGAASWRERAVAADAKVRLVEELHKPETIDVIMDDCAHGECDHEDDCPVVPFKICQACHDLADRVDTYYGERGVGVVACPCATIRAITTQLGN